MEGRSALLGYTGFVGTNLRMQFSFTDLYNSKNISSIRGQKYDFIVCCACPAQKWIANKDPEGDFQRISALMEELKHVEAGAFVLISTIDVYKQITDVDEDHDCSADAPTHHAYGKHRFMFEEFVRSQFPRHFVLRLPALFGPSLRKNYIYDLLHDNNVDQVKLNSTFQWFDVSSLMNDIKTVLRSGVTLVNLFPEPISTQDIVDAARLTGAVSDDVLSKIPPPKSGEHGATYGMQTKYGSLFGSTVERFMYDKDTVRAKLRSYFTREKFLSRVVVSNIAWSPEENDQVYALLKEVGVGKIEIAPTKLWPTWDLINSRSDEELRQVASDLRAKGFTSPSFQAILFGCPDLVLFKDDDTRDGLYKHLCRCVDMARLIAPDHVIPALVFGAPKNRHVGDKTHEECFEVAKAFFQRIGAYAAEKRAAICMEANPRDYDCNFCYSATQAAALVRAVNSPGFRLHLDTACMHLAGDNSDELIRKNIDILHHFHVSEPFLRSLNEPVVDHALAAKALHESGYTGHISIEMRSDNSPAANMTNVSKALDLVLKTYFIA